MTAVLFNLLGEANGAEFFSRMSVASHGPERDTGHTGNFFNILWAMPGVAQSGPNATLDVAARAFINDPTRNRFDRKQRIASVSKIFDWFEEDFVRAAGSILAYVARYVDDPALAKELAQPCYRVEFLDYDWSLNGIPPKETTHAGAP